MRFPKISPAYATSLANRLGLVMTPSATPGTLAGLPEEISATSTGHLSAPDSKLSNGEKAGVGVGVAALLFFLFVTLVAFLMRHRLRRRARASQDPGILPEMDDSKPILLRKWFLGGKWRSEVGDQHVSHELDPGCGPPRERSMNTRVVTDSPAELEEAAI